ncbi:MAG: response regulator [Cyanobacteria bacterium J06600_6]
MPRILIVDDQKTIRETLKTILTPEIDLIVIGAASDGYSAVELAKKMLPDLMLVDLEMPGLNGLNLIKTIHRDLPSIKVIVLSMHDRDEYIQQSLQAGAMGYLLKNTPPKDLIEAIRLVDRGYTQFSPGLLHKAIPTVDTQLVSAPVSLASTNGGVDRVKTSFSSLDFFSSKAPRIRKSWKHYFPYWLLGNLALWGLAIAYLMLKSPTYTSKWAVSLPSSQNSNNINIPDVGSLSTNIESPYRNSLFDPREDYKFLLKEKEILGLAAKQVGLKRQEYGKPEIEIVDNTTMMELSIEGDSPEEAQQKAIALQITLENKLQELRQGQISQTDLNLQGSLAKSEMALQDARQKLADYRASSTLGSRDKAGNLSSNLEQLRRQQAEIESQLKQIKTQSQNLADNLGLDAASAKEAFALHSDSLFQQYLAEYTRMSGEMISAAAKFQVGSPMVVEKQQESESARQAMLQRGAKLLGRTPSPELLQQLNLRTGDENDSYRGSLLKEIVSLQAEAEGLEAKAGELAQQVARLDGKEKQLVEQESSLVKLQQDVKFAETVYSSNLAKSRLAESNLYDAYPQIQVAIQPSLATKPSSPDPALVGLGTFMGSVFLTTAIASLWVSSTAKPTTANSNGNGSQTLTPATDLNTLLKK